MESSAFQLSRIYGQGWNEAKKLLARGEFDIDETHAMTLNPYCTDLEAARWSKGFSEALASRAKTFHMAGRKLPNASNL